MLDGLGRGAGRKLHRKLPLTIQKVQNVPVVELKYKTTLALHPLTISPQELCEGGEVLQTTRKSSLKTSRLSTFHPLFR